MIVDLHHSGKSVKELSSEYDLSDVTVYHWIKKFSPFQGKKCHKNLIFQRLVKINRNYDTI